MNFEVSSGSIPIYFGNPGSDRAATHGIRPQTEVRPGRPFSNGTETAGGQLLSRHGQATPGLPAVVREDGVLADQPRRDVRVACVRCGDVVASTAASDFARLHHGGDRHERAARRRASSGFGPAVDQQTDGDVAGFDRRQFVFLALEARGAASHVRQHRRP